MAIGRHGTDLVQVFGDHLDKSLVTNHQSKMGSQLNEPERTKRPNTGYSNSGLFFFFFFGGHTQIETGTIDGVARPSTISGMTPVTVEPFVRVRMW